MMSFSSVANSVRIFAKSVMVRVWGMESVRAWMPSCISLVMVSTMWLVVFRLWIDVLIDLIVSAMLSKCLDCSKAVALMNLYSHLRLSLLVVLSAISFSEIVVVISVDRFSVSLFVIRKPTDSIVEAMSSVIVFSRAMANRMFTSLVAITSLVEVMKALWTK